MLRNSSPQHGSRLLMRRRADFFLLARGSLRVMDLLHRIHPAVGLGKQTFYIEAVFWAESHAYAERNQFAAADVTTGLDCGLVQSLGFLFCGFRSKSGSGDDELVAPHPGYVIVPAADILQTSREFPQQ